ncbi:MAG: AsnC family transcriptional regulator [Candidatus Hydrogenedentota bacterium]|nr:MAG: AsnC family transcriptional regulator [Candidatus Hydrogenedentota bacterium]
MNLDTLDRKIINALSGDISGTKQPYREIADRLRISEEDLLRRVRDYEKKGLLRRMGAMIAHRVAGVDANGMIIWDVPEDRLEEVGSKLASIKEVTHCYARRRHPEWPYNLYTMVHGRTRRQCENIAERLSKEIGIGQYKVVYSTREFKKTSPRYFVK